MQRSVKPKITPKTYLNFPKQLLCKTNDNILPNYTSEKDLANKFANYFGTKIANIRTELESGLIKDSDNSSDSPAIVSNTQPLRSFANITDDKVSKIILSGNSKSCSLDPMPTSFREEPPPCALAFHPNNH